MAWASKILMIIFRLEYHTLAYYYMTLRLGRSWLEPQRLLLSWLWGSSVHGSSLKDFIFLRLEHHTQAYYYLTLMLECSWLEPQRLLLFWLQGSSIHGLSLKDYYATLLFDRGMVSMTTGWLPSYTFWKNWPNYQKCSMESHSQ